MIRYRIIDDEGGEFRIAIDGFVFPDMKWEGVR